jgi:ABC-2 type transport system ATP-binding protein
MTVVLQTRQLTKRYGKTLALDALDLDIEQGEVFGYLGPNGAGKSTTIALVLGLIRPTSGSASVFGMDVWTEAPAVHRRVAYLAAGAELWPNLTGAETLELFASIHGSVDAPYRAELIERFSVAADTKVRALSHGNRQKLPLVAAFASRAELLLLDEPTSGLDPIMEQVFRECVREARDRGQTVLLSSHILSEVEAVCDRVGMLRSGRLVETGRLDVLRSIVAVRVRAELEGSPPELAGLPGVRNVAVDGHTITCEVTGPMDALVSSLAAAGVRHLSTREPSLEELFLSHYGDSGTAAVAS